VCELCGCTEYTPPIVVKNRSEEKGGREMNAVKKKEEEK